MFSTLDLCLLQYRVLGATSRACRKGAAEGKVAVSTYRVSPARLQALPPLGRSLIRESAGIESIRLDDIGRDRRRGEFHDDRQATCR